MSNKEKRKDIPSGPGNEDKEIYDMEEKINAALDKITRFSAKRQGIILCA